MMIITKRELYGLTGFPIAHSLSPSLFEQSQLARQGGVYQLFPCKEINHLPRLLGAYQPKGLNVTSPHKESILDVLPLLSLSPEVVALRATNTLCLSYQRDSLGRLAILGSAHNTDVVGFKLSLLPLLSGQEQIALILGSGGAARAVHYALISLGIRTYFVSRNGGNENLLSYLRGDRQSILSYENLSEILPQVDIIVQATPLGRTLKVAPQLNYSLLSPTVLGYDLNYYHGAKSPFMIEIERSGGRSTDGSEMLYQQAQAAYALWEDPQKAQLMCR